MKELLAKDSNTSTTSTTVIATFLPPGWEATRSAAPRARRQKAAKAADRQDTAMKLDQELLHGLR